MVPKQTADSINPHVVIRKNKGMMSFLPLAGAAARFEAGMFTDPTGYGGVTLILIFALVFIHRHVRQVAEATANIRFEEAHSPEINVLLLHRE